MLLKRAFLQSLKCILLSWESETVLSHVALYELTLVILQVVVFLGPLLAILPLTINFWIYILVCCIQVHIYGIFFFHFSCFSSIHCQSFNQWNMTSFCIVHLTYSDITCWWTFDHLLRLSKDTIFYCYICSNPPVGAALRIEIKGLGVKLKTTKQLERIFGIINSSFINVPQKG